MASARVIAGSHLGCRHERRAPTSPSLCRESDRHFLFGPFVRCTWVFQTLLRRKFVVFLPALLFAIVAAAIAVSVPNRYTATAMIRFDPRGEKSSHGDATASSMFEKEGLNTQRE